MDSTRVYTKRILDDLKVASAFFADVEFVWKDQKIPTSSLILAALSGMMSTALKDLVYENIDDRIQIIVPDSEIDFGLVSSLFRNILFSPDEDLELDEKYHEVLDYLDIKSSGLHTLTTVGLAENFDPRLLPLNWISLYFTRQACESNAFSNFLRLNDDFSTSIRFHIT